MENYADYTFYKTEFFGKLSDDLFSSNIVKASRIIDANVNVELTQEIINNLSESDKYKLKYVACELCDFINNLDSITNSISIDGVSISSKSNEEIYTNRKGILSKLPIKLTRYL